jgi:hypothetical protein
MRKFWKLPLNLVIKLYSRCFGEFYIHLIREQENLFCFQYNGLKMVAIAGYVISHAVNQKGFQ